MVDIDRGLALACDIDDTLLAVNSRSRAERAASSRALRELCMLITHRRRTKSQPFYFGSATGRTLASHRELEQHSPAFRAAALIMNFMVTSVGSEAYVAAPGGLVKIPDWPSVSVWDRSRIVDGLSGLPELTMQPTVAQGEYKISFEVRGISEAHSAYVETIIRRLAGLGVTAEVIFSSGIFLDILPEGINKGTGLLRAMAALPPADDRSAAGAPLLIVAGDSMNDRDMLRVADGAILPGNAHDSLKQWANDSIAPDRLYIAGTNFAQGVIEGYAYFTQELNA